MAYEKEYTTKVVTNEEFFSFTKLVIKLKKSHSPELNEFQIINDLISKVNSYPTFKVFGLYLDNILIGCIYGYKSMSGSFLVEGIYCLKQKDGLFLLVNFWKDALKVDGYTKYEASIRNPLVNRIVKFLGESKIISTTILGEI